jgi:glycosyltransferase involved in cell wall biosynthesis
MECFNVSIMAREERKVMDEKIAVLIPCYNEEATIKDVILEFRKALPSALIYVYDNNSSDETSRIAKELGAVVRHEYRQGKGFVLKRMFAEIEADVYLLVDGDLTYDPSVASKLVDSIIKKSCDMAVASRNELETSAYRAGHKFGNKFLTGSVNKIFGESIKDMLSGYRALSRRFVKSFPIQSSGFEIETEITIHALELNMRIDEIESEYRARPSGSESKLKTYSDGWKIILFIFNLFRQEKPLTFFLLVSVFFLFISILLFIPVLSEFINTGLVPRLPTAILSMGIMILSILSVACGLILDTVTRGRKEVKLLNYLKY